MISSRSDEPRHRVPEGDRLILLRYEAHII
jgi:hypothetical protein